jgi:hypothetical protein
MKRYLILSFLIAYSFLIYAIDFKKIEKHVDNTPVSKTKNTIVLSEYLTADFQQDDEKFAAIYFWIAKNIDYDVKSRYETTVYKNVDEIVVEVMKKKKGVCQHFSELFNELSKLAGLESYVVNGYGKEYGKVMNLAHAWNVVKVEGEFYFVDATWGAGHINPEGKYERDFSLEYFMVTPEKFIDDHISFDPMWQLLRRPLFFEEFEYGINYNISRPDFNFKDSIKYYFTLSLIDRIKSKIRRIEQNGQANKLVKFELDYEWEYLRILEFNEQVRLFNNANEYYNKGVTQLNEFNSLKRRKVNDGSVSVKKLGEKLAEMEKNLSKAKELYSKVDTENIGLKANLKKAKTNVLKFDNIIKQQKAWLSGLSD